MKFVREQLANPADVKSHYYFAIIPPIKKGQLLRLAEIFNSEDISFEQSASTKSQWYTCACGYHHTLNE